MSSRPRRKRLALPRLRRLPAVFAVVTALVCGGGAFLTVRSLVGGIQTQAAARIVDAAAVVAATDPDRAGEIVQALTRRPDAATVREGRRALRRYGYDERAVTALEPSLRIGDPLAAAAGGFAVLAAAGVLAAALAVMQSLLARVDDIAAVAERVADGEFSIDPYAEEEGSLGRLSHQVSQTAHRLAEQVSLVQAEKEKLKEVLSDISHQLKTPLASVRMFQELLLEEAEQATEDTSGDGPPEHRRREFLTRSLLQIDRMEWLIKNLLIVARMEAGALPIQLQDLPIEDTVRTAVHAFHRHAEEGGLELSLHVHEPVLRIAHDPRWIEEAISNLVKNAVEHTPDGGRVTVEVASTELFARITVADTGAGIRPEDLPHLFERFYQGRGPGRAGGTGIGLALAKAIVERHGGFISADSAPDGGARFAVTLPRSLTNL